MLKLVKNVAFWTMVDFYVFFSLGVGARFLKNIPASVSTQSVVFAMIFFVALLFIGSFLLGRMCLVCSRITARSCFWVLPLFAFGTLSYFYAPTVTITTSVVLLLSAVLLFMLRQIMQLTITKIST